MQSLNYFRSCKYWLIWLSFLVALILQSMPWPESLSLFRPSWLLLILIYWILIMPDRINIGTAFSMGIVTDLIYGSTLGLHSLAFSVIAYIVSRQNHQICNLMLWKQALSIIILAWVMDIIIFISNLLVINVVFCPEQLWNGVTSGILWPWMFLLMHKIGHNLFSNTKVVF
ncbi:Rod shape-determining protein MreD [Candidatus Erwinia haradaeae]|uniref:Rod shape-determining protein MreD n=2 Tax=Candidatus Erwinia haradaeae TaxID=1922217 RepID=A0A451D848_9GAMM|nr:rod shape-determining protein MreD [Candidatus Erwinia haradaeae]VFP81988.1 Rod shape-determining protein MreD [Candidatus Erwinia haradaeae]